MRLLFLTPEPTLQHRVQVLLDEDDGVVVAAASTADALRHVRAGRFDAAIVDARKRAYATFAGELAEARTLPILALLDRATAGSARDLLAAGVADVIELSWIEPLLVRRLLPLIPASAEGEPTPKRRAQRLRKQDVIIGESPALNAVMRQIDMVARSHIGVLVRGETGTGKELVARTLHRSSSRRGAAFVVANCTALPEPLFENELFGHERGAYTGADRRRDGLISAAEGGTLLLDEIGDVSAGIQAKLLRLLQFHEYKRIGGSVTLKADVRIMATTHRDLRRLVTEGSFRQDLYYRLNTLEIVLPPLRERLQDIPLLADHFVRLFGAKNARPEGEPLPRLTAEALRYLQSHDWPGNILELENAVNRCLVMATGSVIDASDIDLVGAGVSQLDTPRAALEILEPDLNKPFAEQKAAVVERFERSYLQRLLELTGGNLSRASQVAQHERKSLWRLLKKYAIDPAAFR